MRFEIVAKQDYSSRIGGSWGGVIFDTTGEVDDFLALADKNRSRLVSVEDNEGNVIAGPLNADEWQVWKEENNLV